MLRIIRAKFTGGALKPLERLDLEEGAEVILSIEDAPTSDEVAQALRTTAGAWKGKHDPEELKRVLHEARLAGSREELYARAEAEETESDRRRRLLNEVFEDICATRGGFKAADNISREDLYSRHEIR